MVSPFFKITILAVISIIQNCPLFCYIYVFHAAKGPIYDGAAYAFSIFLFFTENSQIQQKVLLHTTPSLTIESLQLVPPVNRHVLFILIL